MRESTVEKNLYTQADFLKLTSDDINAIREILDLNIPDKEDEREYIYRNLNIIEENDETRDIVSKKVLAGSGAIKWYKFEYDDTLTKEELINQLKNNKYVLKENIPDEEKQDEIIAVMQDKNIFTIKIVLKDGTQIVSDGISYRREIKWKTIISKIDVDNKWIEIRGSGEKCEKAKRIIINSLTIHTISDVNILENYGYDITKFKDSLENGRYMRFRAMPNKNIKLTKEDGILLSGIINSIDSFLIDKDEKKLLLTLQNINDNVSGISLLEIFLAGIEHVSLKITDDDNNDMTNQGLYSVLKKGISEDTSYLHFDTYDGKVKKTNTIQVGKSTNSITFRNSVTEDVIEYIRNKVL